MTWRARRIETGGTNATEMLESKPNNQLMRRWTSSRRKRELPLMTRNHNLMSLRRISSKTKQLKILKCL
jgi:hypothetical protein